MANKPVPYKIYLSEDEIPKQWYNLNAVMSHKHEPFLNPATLQPCKPEELKALSAEIASLHAKIRTINDEFYANMSKAGLPCGDYGCAWHGSRDGYGYGYGHGHGRHGCWR